MHTEKSSRMVLVPLATMLVAGAVAVGSGATYSSESSHSTSVTSGILKHANDRNGQTLTITGIKPGDVKTGTLTITNNGTLDSTLSLEEVSDSSTFVTGDLKLKVVKDGVTAPLFDGNFGALVNGAKLDLGALPVNATTTVTYTVSMPSTAENANQGKTASSSFKYVTTQAGDNSTVGWF